MNSLIIVSIVLLFAFGILLFIYISSNKRIYELKEKTIFASSADELVKVEMTGNDALAKIAGNFNVLGEKLIGYRKSNSELSGIKYEKQKLSDQVQGFRESLSQVSLLTDIGKKIIACLNIQDIVLKYYNFISSSMVAEEINLLIINRNQKNYYTVFNGKMEEIKDRVWGEDKDNILNWCFDNNKETFLNNASRDYGRYVFKPPQMVAGGLAESIISIPLGMSNKIMGAVSILSGTKNTFTDFHLEFARSLSSYMSVAIDNSNLYSELVDEREKSEKLLLNILPEEVAEELKHSGRSEARQYDNVTVLFTDFVNFTGVSEKLSPKELVSALNEYFIAFDEIIEKHGLEKIKTIGDAYLAVCGMPNENADHALNSINAAREILAYITEKKSAVGLFDIRIGIHSGAVVAGIVGIRKFAFDIWGDTVNLASRMESSSEAGKINISGATYELVKDKIKCKYRGKIEAKNKGMIDMYFVEST